MKTDECFGKAKQNARAKFQQDLEADTDDMHQDNM